MINFSKGLDSAQRRIFLECDRHEIFRCDRLEAVAIRALLQYHRGIKDRLEPWAL